MANPRLFHSTAVGNLTASENWIFDPFQVASDNNATGMWRALTPQDFQVTVDSVNISGINIATDQLEGMVTSGAQYLANISGRLSGTLVFAQTGSNTTAFGTTSVQGSSISGSMSTITTGLALAANPTRKSFYAQVIGSGGPLWLAYNNAAASSTNWHVALKAASSDQPAIRDPGMDGGNLSDSDFKGPVYVSGFIGCRFNIWEAL